jgi:hypothetical protein
MERMFTLMLEKRTCVRRARDLVASGRNDQALVVLDRALELFGELADLRLEYTTELRGELEALRTACRPPD